MDVANTFIIGSVFILLGAIASLIPLSKARNHSYLASALGALFFLAAIMLGITQLVKKSFEVSGDQIR